MKNVHTKNNEKKTMKKVFAFQSIECLLLNIIVFRYLFSRDMLLITPRSS